MPAVRSLQKVLNRMHEDLSTACESNIYTLEYLIMAGEAPLSDISPAENDLADEAGPKTEEQRKDIVTEKARASDEELEGNVTSGGKTGKQSIRRKGAGALTAASVKRHKKSNASLEG
jgi:hypothetical protein